MSSRLRGPSTSSTAFLPDLLPACAGPESWLYSAVTLCKWAQMRHRLNHNAGCVAGQGTGLPPHIVPIRHATAAKPEHVMVVVQAQHRPAHSLVWDVPPPAWVGLQDGSLQVRVLLAQLLPCGQLGQLGQARKREQLRLRIVCRAGRTCRTGRALLGSSCHSAYSAGQAGHRQHRSRLAGCEQHDQLPATAGWATANSKAWISGACCAPIPAAGSRRSHLSGRKG